MDIPSKYLIKLLKICVKLIDFLEVTLYKLKLLVLHKINELTYKENE